ncbi:MAG: GNAT family N-acetyltransferase [Bacteroidota bacterium]
MQIRKVNRDSIDALRWDNFIENSTENTVFAKAFFLDTVSPHWSALILARSDEWVAVLPFQTTTKLGFTSIRQNPFTNELGIYRKKGEDDYSSFLVDKLLTYSFISRYHFNQDNHIWTDLECFNEERTFLLDLNTSFPVIEKQYSSNLKRNLKKATKNGLRVIRDDHGIKTLLEVLRKYVIPMEGNAMEANQLDTLNKVYSILKEKKLAAIYFVKNPAEEVLSVLLLVKSGKKLIYYAGGSTPKGKEESAQHFLLNHVIQHHAGTNQLFDFEAKNDTMEGLCRFYRSFGAHESRYASLRKMKWNPLFELRRKMLQRR